MSLTLWLSNQNQKKKLLTLEKSLNKEMGFALCPKGPQSDLGYMCSFLVYVSLGTDFKHI